jgi:hydroxymethylpyrimidine pyrophosphatase-like HAD family hydrolase
MKLQFLDNIKVFIFDIGKTLFDKQVHTKCSQSTIAALNLLRQKGYKVGVCTMRTFNHIRDIIDFTFDFYILNNGSFVMCENNILLDEPMNVEITKRDYLTYTPYETFFSSKKRKGKSIIQWFHCRKRRASFNFL